MIIRERIKAFFPTVPSPLYLLDSSEDTRKKKTTEEKKVRNIHLHFAVERVEIMICVSEL